MLQKKAFNQENATKKDLKINFEVQLKNIFNIKK